MILFMAPRPFCLRFFFTVLTFRPVVPPGWSLLGFLLCAPGSHSLCLFVHCVCTALGPPSFLLPSSLAASSLRVLCPWLPSTGRDPLAGGHASPFFSLSLLPGSLDDLRFGSSSFCCLF